MKHIVPVLLIFAFSFGIIFESGAQTIDSVNTSGINKKTHQLLDALEVLSKELDNGYDANFAKWIYNKPDNRLPNTDTINNKELRVKYDTLDKVENDEVMTNRIEEELDRLIDKDFIKGSLNSDENSDPEETVHIDDLSDSVIIERLNRIPSAIQYTYNKKVNSFIKLYLKKRREQVAAMIGLSEYYFPMFERILYAEDLPMELKYLPIIESALNPTAYSHAGASGLWQFMYQTGKLYDLDVNSLVDERRAPLQSTHAAAAHLKSLYNKYNDWMLVIAAYNCGQGNVDRAMRRTGKKNFWDLYYYLPRETRGYVPAFIAANYVMNYYKQHNIKPADIDLPQNVDTVRIVKRLHLKQVSKKLNISVETLRELNPQYRKNIIPATNDKPYTLNLPEEKALKFAETENKIYAYNRDDFFNDTQVKTVSSRGSSRNRSHNSPDVAGKEKVYYTIKSGDNIGYIAEWFNVRASDIRYWNHKRTNRLIAGKKLLIYVPQEKASYYRKFNSMSFAAKQKAIGESPNRGEEEEKQKAHLSDDYVYYKVRRGDNLWTIAKKFSGISNKDIIRINNFSYNDVQHLKPGDVIKIKAKSS